MKTIAKLPNSDRSELFRNTANKMGLNDAIVEKDFWVCLMLDYLFNQSPWKHSIAFKGGTSLSKAYHLIDRFSEDIDLILDWRIIGYGINEPWDKRSNTKQDAFNKQANQRVETFLADTLCPKIRDELYHELRLETNIHMDSNDKKTVIFAYPNLFTSMSAMQVIRLEIGALAAWTPVRSVNIVPYAAEQYPSVFQQKFTNVLAVAPERTFWEKAAILHHEANRPENIRMPQRYSRHYYDLYRMSLSHVRKTALSHLDMLQRVVDFKMKFYPRAWARYSEAVPGTFKLVPPQYRLAMLEADYATMGDMIYGVVPSFEDVMGSIHDL